MGTEKIAQLFMQNSEDMLSMALLAAGIMIVVLALSSADKWIKALALAYVILP